MKTTLNILVATALVATALLLAPGCDNKPAETAAEPAVKAGTEAAKGAAPATEAAKPAEPAIKVALSPEWSVNAVWVLQPIRDPGPDDDRVFEDHGLFVEELHVDYETDRLAVSAGKLTPNFGKA